MIVFHLFAFNNCKCSTSSLLTDLEQQKMARLSADCLPQWATLFANVL